MNIQVGEIQMSEVTEQKIVISTKVSKQVVRQSKTTKYLVPCLKEYGKVFTAMINSVYKIAAGIGDAIVINREIKHEKHIYLLVDSSISPLSFIKFLDWVREADMYVDDYVYGDIQKSNFHMFILQFPEKYYDSFETFKLGEYSKMYQPEDVEKFFSKNPKVKGVLVKEHEYRISFTKKLNKLYETTILPEELEGELDFKPSDISEIFNHHLKR